MIQKALAPATQAAYKRCLDSFVQFCHKYAIDCSLPIASTNLLCFIQFLFNTGHPASTIASNLSALSYYHKLLGKGSLDPTKSFAISQIMVAIRKERPSTDGRKPISHELLLALCEKIVCLNLTIYETALFKAMFCLMFHFGLRVGEVTLSQHNLRLDQVEVRADLLKICFATYKHSPSQPFNHYIKAAGITPCPVAVVSHYVNLRGSLQGPLFLLAGKAVTRDIFVTRLREVLALCHVNPSEFSSHSFRIGAASMWAAQGLPFEQIRRLGRWQSEAGLKYIRHDIDHTVL